MAYGRKKVCTVENIWGLSAEPSLSTPAEKLHMFGGRSEFRDMWTKFLRQFNLLAGFDKGINCELVILITTPNPRISMTMTSELSILRSSGRGPVGTNTALSP